MDLSSACPAMYDELKPAEVIEENIIFTTKDTKG